MNYMPAVSKKQYKFFQYLKNNEEAARKVGASKKLIKEYTDNMTEGRWKRLKDHLQKKK